MKVSRRFKYLLPGSWILGALFVPTVRATDLQPETVAAFDVYVRATEARMGDDLRDGHFLYEDQLPIDLRLQVVSQIRKGELYVEELHSLDNGSVIRIPGGLIHHWIGLSFIPGVTYSQAINVLLDFEKQREIYKPDVQKSKVLEKDGNRSKIYIQYFKKSLVTVVLNADFDATYTPMGPLRGEIRSYSTRIAEIQNAGQPNERELPVGKDHGYMWRLYSYWRIEERDGGVYLQVESIALSRRVPTLIAWLVNPIVRNLSKAVIANLLNGTRKGILNSVSNAAPDVSPNSSPPAISNSSDARSVP